MKLALQTRKTRSLAIALFAAVAVVALGVGPALSSGAKPRFTEDNRASEPQTKQVLGLGQAELLYVPITPCKLAGITVGKNKSRTLYAAGATGFAGQGGKSTGCAIPTSAASVTVNVTVRQATKAGELRAWAAGSAQPAFSTMLYPKKSAAQEQLTLPLLNGAGKDLSVKSVKAKAKYSIVAVGYYVPQMSAYISSSGTILDQSGRLISATKTGTGTYTLIWDRDISACTGQGTSDLTGHIVSVYTSGTSSYVYTVNNAGGAEDYWTNILISC